jgi:LuxR family maltose regulon positive regulatory protein
MTKQFDVEMITEIHNRAGRWFAKNDLPDEALPYLMSAGNIPAARDLIVANRYHLTKREQWHRLERWLNLLPIAVIENDPELLIAKAWLHENRERTPELVQALETVEQLVDAHLTDPPPASPIIGELNAFRAGHYYLNGDVQQAEKHANQAVAQIPKHHLSESGFANLIWAFTLQMKGEAKRARQWVYDTLSLDETGVSTYSARMLLTLCFFDRLQEFFHSVRNKI